MVFERTMGAYERIFRINFKWKRKKQKYTNSKCIWINFWFMLWSNEPWHNFCLKARSENGYGFYRSGLKTGVENAIFWSEIGSGTPPPRIPRSTPPPPFRASLGSSDQTFVSNWKFLPSSINFHFRNEATECKTFPAALSLPLKKGLGTTMSLWAKSYGAGIQMKPICKWNRLQSTIYFLRFNKTKFNFGFFFSGQVVRSETVYTASPSQGLMRSER